MGSSTTMRAERVEMAGAQPAEVGECPVWRTAEDALYWVDIVRGQLLRLHPGSGALTRWQLPERIGCFAFDRHGVLIAGLESGLFAVDLRGAPAGGNIGDETGDGPAIATRANPDDATCRPSRIRRLAAPDFPLPDMRFNDGRCDRQGRFWAGTMAQDTTAAHALGSLYRYDARAGLSVSVVDGLIVQNGLAWSPDGRTMYLSDSHPDRRLVWAYDYHTETGWPSNRRLFADLRAHAGRPDGAAVDADGGYWCCANDAGCVLRFTPAGQLDRAIDLPATKPSMCAFGGPDFATLYITTIRPGAHASEHDGHLFAVRPGVRGLPETAFAGELGWG